MAIEIHINYALISSRASFEELQHNFFKYWVVLDYTSDFIYLLDMAFRTRTGKRQMTSGNMFFQLGGSSAV
jgi:hypothetical protein